MALVDPPRQLHDHRDAGRRRRQPRAKDSATYTGKLVRLERGEGDSEEGEDVDVFELEFSCDSVVS